MNIFTIQQIVSKQYDRFGCSPDQTHRLKVFTAIRQQ